MPGYKIHISGGILCALAAVIGARAAGIISPHHTPELLGAALCGALFPDIDTHSMGRRMMYFLAGVGALVGIMLGHLRSAALWVIALFVLSSLPHRGPTHRVTFLAVLAALLLVCIALLFPAAMVRGMWVVLFFMIGAVSHLMLDGRLIRKRKRRR